MCPQQDALVSQVLPEPASQRDFKRLSQQNIQQLAALSATEAAAAAKGDAAAGQASAAADTQAANHAVLYSTATSTAQAVGSCAHELLQLALHRESRSWQAKDIEAMAGGWMQRLAQFGVPPAQMQQALLLLQRAMQGALFGSEGCALLNRARANGIAEWELLAKPEQQQAWQRSRIDLAFVDDGGQRWVVDYKIAEPEKNESLECFFDRQRQSYSEQLQRYALMIAKLEDRSPESINAALFFPLIDRLLPISPF
ncbi:MAG: hypothetical protein HKO07_05200 [Pseudomonadales bacterium]|nr:hypothetical protein [Pseudomonadales bacterium]